MFAFSKRKRQPKDLFGTLDRIFSLFIRLRDADNSGYCCCITCGKIFHWKNGDAGHFIPRDRHATRYNTKNVNFQCLHCNRFRSGEQYAHGIAIDKKYGTGTADQLKLLSQSKAHLKDFWLQYHIDLYRQKVKQLKKEKGL